jgi:rRNA maturation protein Rpf1
VFPDSVRFNRGGMSRAEIIARVVNQEANFVIIVTMYKGNPSNLEIISSEGEPWAKIHMESAMLRREVLESSSPRINSIYSVEVKKDSTRQTIELAHLIGSLVNTDVIESTDVNQTSTKSSAIIWFQDLNRGKTLWTFYHAFDGIEIGPRIRVKSLIRSIEK